MVAAGLIRAVSCFAARLAPANPGSFVIADPAKRYHAGVIFGVVFPRSFIA